MHLVALLLQLSGEGLHRDYDTIDLVILDLSMPRMSGWELMTAMLTINPRARIVLCSGYPLDPSERKGARALVAKPFECSELLQTLRQVIAEDVTPAPGPSLSAV